MDDFRLFLRVSEAWMRRERQAEGTIIKRNGHYFDAMSIGCIVTILWCTINLCIQLDDNIYYNR